MVSVICNAYNHEKYIAEAIESFLMQEAPFSFEILINDDASTDGTAGIIRQYAERYPEIIKPLLHTENQESKGKDSSLDFQIPRAKGKYIAFCEGDDYWTDPEKLKRQFELMESHPELDICAHAVNRVAAETKELLEVISPSREACIFSPEEVIMGGGGFVGTNSLFYRSSIDKSIPRFRREFPYDYSIQIHGSLRGGMLYTPDVMSSYRSMAQGSWSARQKKAEDRQRHEDGLKNMFQLLDEYTGGSYHSVIEKRKLKRDFVHLHSDGKYAEMLQDKYNELFKELRFRSKLKVYSFAALEKATSMIKKKQSV